MAHTTRTAQQIANDLLTTMERSAAMDFAEQIAMSKGMEADEASDDIAATRRASFRRAADFWSEVYDALEARGDD